MASGHLDTQLLCCQYPKNRRKDPYKKKKKAFNWYLHLKLSARYQSPFYQALLSIRPQLAAAAQSVYDGWDQSSPDGDPELGFGGICQDIAEEIANVVGSMGYNAGTMSAQCGEQHVWAIAYREEQDPELGMRYEGYHVDIPYHIYETGGGYNWKKIPHVQFNPNDISIYPMSHDDVAGYLEYGDM